jgi:glycine/D-amino acid oxidase-like deaminating enzyme
MPPHLIVVGAGPAGALLAFLLARRSHSVTLLESTRDFAGEFRGEVLMPSGLEALDQTGLWAEVDALPHVPLCAVEAANELVPVLDSGADAGALDAACRRVEALRLPEVRTIQPLQALPPRVLFRKTWWARLVLELVPRLLGSDIARARRGTAFRRFAFGVTEVRLRV